MGEVFANHTSDKESISRIYKQLIQFNSNKQMITYWAFSAITSWQIDGETMETVTDFIFLGFKIAADSDCSHEIKRCLLLGRKAMTNLDSILKSRDIALLTKAHLVKVTVFSSSHVWMWELDHKESWEPKNWYFWTVVLEKTLETARRPLGLQGNQTSQS